MVLLAGEIRSFRHDSTNVVINEVCTSNVKNCKDDNGDYPDWVELYNPTDSDIDISGYVFSKSFSKKNDKYEIPSGTIMTPGSYFVFDPEFPMSSSGCGLILADVNNSPVDSVIVPKLKYDTVYARREDGQGDWGIKEPSPGWSNNESTDIAPILDGIVLASSESGFYDEDFELKLASSNTGRKIYYTLDGSDPVKNGIPYENPIHITDRSTEDNIYSAIPDVSTTYIDGISSMPSFPVDKCTVVSCVAKDSEGMFTKVCRYTYFVGFNSKDAYDDMTVISVVADPDDLFSYDKGIMVLGEYYDQYVAAGKPKDGYNDWKANFEQRGRESEREADLTIFDENHSLMLDKKCNMRLKGLSSRNDEQKSFSIVFRKAVGGNYKEKFKVGGIDFDVHAFVLDKCGQDIETKMKDTIMEYCMFDSSCATTHRIPCCLFLNGEYWGFYWLAERFDRSYLADRYGVNKESVEIKDTQEYESYRDWPVEEVDRESLIEYYAANIIVSHEGDWPYTNYRMWHTDVEGGTEFSDSKYRMMIFDMNSDSMENSLLNSFEYLIDRFPPFSDRLGIDKSFAADLCKKIDEMSKDEFEKGKMISLVDDFGNRIRGQMILDRMRYFDCSREEAEKSFDDHVEILREFYVDRYDNLDIMKKKFLSEYR